MPVVEDESWFPLTNVQRVLFSPGWQMPDQCWWLSISGVQGCLPAAVKQKRIKPTGAHARVQEKVRGHFTIVCGYINVCSDLSWESGLCSSASGRQIGADRQARPHCCEHNCKTSIFPSAVLSLILTVRIFCTLYSSPSYVLFYISRSCAASGNHRRWG